MKLNNLIICSVMLFSVVFMTDAANAEAGKFTVKSDISFLNRGRQDIKADVYIPAAGSAAVRLPAVVLIHGGGFVTGDKTQANAVIVAEYLASRGYIVFNANYRLAKDGGIIPENVYDVKCAVKWFRSRATDYGADPERVAILGMSAGGYLASMIAVTPHNADFEPKTCGDERADKASSSVPFAVIWYGIHDFATLRSSSASTLDTFLFRGVKNKAEFKKKVSPVTYADAASPMLLLHGLSDSLVPYQQSREMCEAMKAASRECSLVEFPGAEHAFIDPKNGGDAIFNAALKESADWFDKKFSQLK